MIKIKFNHLLGHPWPNKRKPGHVYARAIGTTIYFESPKKNMLEQRRGIFKYEGLFRHELEHVYQRKRVRFFTIKYYWDSLKNLIEHKSIYLAYHWNRYEVEAREAEKKGLTDKERELFLNA